MADHGTRTRYNQGCTDGPEGTACDPCKLANRDYFKKYGQDKKAEQLATVTDIAAASAAAVELIGPAEQAVVNTLAGLPTADKRPDLVASARAMARLLDNPLYAAQQTAAAKELRSVMDQLLKGSEKKGRLAAVRQLSRPESAAG